MKFSEGLNLAKQSPLKSEIKIKTEITLIQQELRTNKINLNKNEKSNLFPSYCIFNAR